MTSFALLSDDRRNELWASLALRHAWGVGALRAKGLVDEYGSAYAAVKVGLERPREWEHKGLASSATALRFAGGGWREKAGLEWTAAKNCRAGVLLLSDENYPAALRTLPDAPLLLYYLGDVSLLHGPSVGVVGARRCTREGIAVSAFFARDLSLAGVSVVSGLARGIDRAAHIAGLQGPGGTIAVLGTGIDVPYPICNADLYEKLAARGLLISEFSPGTPPRPGHFPIHNRIISGLSQGVLIVEAASRSGSLITARLALEQDRDVFVVPGHTMAAVSQGCRDLIRKGAKPVFNADDILNELAPLLTLEARKALTRRREEAARVKNDEHAQEAAAFSEASEVLPPGELPWEAPHSGPVRTAEKALSASPVRPAGFSPARSGQAKSALAGSTPVSPPAPDFPAPALPGCASPDAQAPAPGFAPCAMVGPEGGEAAVGPAPENGEAAVARNLEGDEAAVAAALTATPRHIDDLAEVLDWEVPRLSALLTRLEMRGFIRREPGMYYALCARSGGV